MTNKYNNGTAVVPSFLCKNPLRHMLLLAVLLLGTVGAQAQTDYVFYNGTYGYLYNDNGTLKSSTSLQFDKSSMWTASDNLGNTGRTISSYTNSSLYLRTSTNNGGTVSLINASGSNWQMRNNALCVREGNTSYYLKASSATAFTTASGNNGNQYTPYAVTITDIAAGLSGFTVSGTSSINATGTYSDYTHTNATYYASAYTDYYFSNTHHYVNTSNASTTTNPATTISSASYYSWSLSDNAEGYATVNASTGAVTVSNIPTKKTTFNLICTLTYNEQTVTASFPITLTLTGVSGGTVTIDDREDHSWSYYSDPTLPQYLRSLNPADVKISYLGNGKMYTSTTATPSGSLSDATGVKVGIDASEHTFVYYKTLERTDGATATTVAGATGRCPYTTIPNPFSVRPTFTASGTKYYTGFYTWRVKSVSGGTIYNAATGGTAIAAGGTIDAETEVFFAPNASTGMEVELEAVWARAYLYTGSGTVSLSGDVTYERNFVIGGAGVSYPATYSSIYPDGTNGTTAATMNDITSYNAGTRTLGYDTKFEYINLTGGTYTANNHYLCFGRGISTANNAGTIQGINGAATALSYTLRVESGQFSAFSFVRDANTTVSGRVQLKATLGCDYDRATTTNDKLLIAASSTMFFSTNVTYSSNTNKDVKVFEGFVKSGSIQSSYWNGSGDADYQHTFYCGQNSAGNTYPGTRYLTIEGGEMGSVCGGRGVGGTSTTYMTPEVITFDLRIKGGLIHGGVYGGAADNPSIGSRRFVITGGEIQGWIAGGCNGTGSTNGTGATDGDAYIYVGGDVVVGGSDPTTVNDTEGGQVFGAGRGLSGRLSSVNHSYVVVADDASVSNASSGSGYVYGGSYNGTIGQVSNVYVVGGNVEGKVFGGSYGNTTDIPNVNVNMTGGVVTDGVYGGSNSTGTISGNVTMQIDGGTVGSGNAGDGIYGGGYGSSTVVSGNVDLTLGTIGQTTAGVTVNGDVYGGSALGNVNGTTANTTYHTNVTLNKGTVEGSIYGGALGDNTTAAYVYSPVAVTVNGGTVNGAVYGCNNIKGTPRSTVRVTINGSDPTTVDGSGNKVYAIQGVYGGGNQAAYDPATAANGCPQVVVNGCATSIADVFGGGNAAPVPQTDVKIYGGDIGRVFAGGNGVSGTPANVGYNNKLEPTTANSYGSGTAAATIYGGTIGQVFGGSNAHGVIRAGTTVTINSDGTCPLQVGEVFGGGNLADSKPATVNVVCTGEGLIDYVYGGANQADVDGDIELNITGGRIEHVFGGNNLTGTVSGTIVVNVDWDEGSCSSNYLGYVYGGGNQATYTYSSDPVYPQVNIKNGTVTHDVFGGGYGDPNDASKGVVTGTPKVIIGVENAAKQANVLGRVFGGGNAAAITGSTDMRVLYNSTVGGSIFGGGNAAAVTADTFVLLNHKARCYGNVYGGGNQGAVGGDTKVIINSSK